MKIKTIYFATCLGLTVLVGCPTNIFASPSTQSYNTSEGIVVRGTIRDAEGSPIVGATVSVKGKPQGTITDSNGNYSIRVENTSAVLKFSFIGYVAQERKIGAKKSIDVKLLADSQSLDEVVVVGYGTQKKSDLTGAISSVNVKELPASATASVENMLAGQVSGMQITSTDAQPGGGIKILIRGQGTVNSGAEPLYVIDGFPVSGSVDPGLNTGGRYQSNQGPNKTTSGRSPLNTINPNDIESIEVLKDASATAIYGARAANGVILITTKSGKKGKPKINYDMKFGISTMSNQWDVMNATQWYQARNSYGREQYLMNNKIYPYGNTDPSTVDPYKPTYSPEQIANAGAGTDWTKAVTQTGITTEHNVSINGATDYTNYMASVNYYNQKGIVKNNDMTRYTGRFNLQQKVRRWLTAGLNATGSRIQFKDPVLGSGSTEDLGVLGTAREFSPDLPIRDANGDYTLMKQAGDIANPVSLLNVESRTTQDRLLAQGFLDFKPIDGLSIRLQAGIDKQDGTQKEYIPTTTLYGKQKNGTGIINTQNNLDEVVTLTGHYEKTFSKIHHLDALAGYEFDQVGSEYHNMNVNNFSNDFTGFDNMGGGQDRPNISSGKSVYQVASYFARVNYGLMDKYLFSASVRADGSDKFGANHRWGVFPAGAFAWRISQENFMKDVSWISNLKLRLSAGQTGNSNIQGSSYGYFSIDGKRDYVFGNSLNSGAYMSQFANPNLKWETTTEYNLGLDMGFLKNRINVTLELYSKQISDLIQQRQMMYYLPQDYVWANIGATSSKGFDIGINTVNVEGEFTWTTNLNLSAYIDKWKQRDPAIGLNPYETNTDPLRVIWGYQTDGLIQPGETVPYGNYGPGSQKVVDRNHDGVINDQDKVKLYNQDPFMSFGFNNNFSYKNFDLSINMYGLLGWHKSNSYLSNFHDLDNKILAGYNYTKVDLNKFWSSTNMNAKYPNLYNMGKNAPGSTQFAIENASFLRVRDITLGYNFAALKNVSKWVNQLHVYVDVSNPFLFTKFTQIDPEYDGTYPSSRSFTFGLNFQF